MEVGCHLGRTEVACPKRGGKKQMNNVFLKLLTEF